MNNPYHRIYLIGYMASGKSTVGIKLAEAMGYGFVDTDQAIEKIKGLTINAIFNEKGEDSFRNEESKMALFTTQIENVVISTGGGLPIFNDNMSFINNHGITIYLKVPADKLADRILNDRNVRPLHKVSTKATILKDVKLKLESRESIYAKARLTIDGCLKTDIIVKNIIAHLNKHKARHKR